LQCRRATETVWSASGDEIPGITLTRIGSLNRKSQIANRKLLLATFISNSPLNGSNRAANCGGSCGRFRIGAQRRTGQRQDLVHARLVAGLKSDAAVTSRPLLSCTNIKVGDCPFTISISFVWKIENQPCGLDWKIIF